LRKIVFETQAFDLDYTISTLRAWARAKLHTPFRAWLECYRFEVYH